MIALIDKFSEQKELRQLYLNQLKSITSTKFELEQLQQAKQLEKLKHEVVIFKEELIAETEHENWIKQQKRLLERKKIEKELAAQGINVNRNKNNNININDDKIITMK